MPATITDTRQRGGIRPLRDFLHTEAAGGLLLAVAALAALVWANLPGTDSYSSFWHHTISIGFDGHVLALDLRHWVNEAAMTIFFLVVGLEIKREVLVGELSTPAQRRLPVLAAIGGMAVPALIYLGVAGSEPGLARGWAIPAATDIAFAVGVLALLGKRGPPALRLFLLTVAIVDDLGAVAIIAVFYTAQLKLAWLGAGLAVLAAMALLGRLRVERGWVYVLLAMAAWYCVLHSGVHATVAGVLAAFTIPLRLDGRGDSLLLRMEHALVPWNAYVVVPLFGFANAGVALGGLGLAGLLAPLPLAVAAGLFIGKQVGILAAVMLAEKTGFARRPEGASTLQLWGMALLCGIGFTMSLFIGALAFPGDPLLVDEAKIGVLAGSLLSALAGYTVLRLASARG